MRTQSVILIVKWISAHAILVHTVIDGLQYKLCRLCIWKQLHRPLEMWYMNA